MSSQRGLVQRIERKLEVSVGDAFARVFGGSIVPQEVEAMLRREAAEGIRPIAGDRLLAPNEYIITLGMHDYQKVSADPDLTSDAFAKHLARYIGEQGWQTYGDVVIRFEQSANLHTGQFRTRGAVNPDVEPRPIAGEFAPRQSDHAFSAEPGVTAMSENSSYGGGHGQGRPGDDHYEDPYAQPHDDPHAAPDPRGAYQPEPGGYPEQRGGYPDQPGYGAPDQRGGYPEQGAGYDQGYGGGGYGRQDYGQSYAPPGGGGGYAEPGRDYEYGQPADASGYGGGYGQQGGYSSSGSAVTLQLDDGSGRTYQLREGPNVIGRGQDAQFRLPDTGVSRRHLEIRWDGQVALLSDLNSTNGTTVNNAPVQEWQLADGDVIRLGHSEIVVHIH